MTKKKDPTVPAWIHAKVKQHPGTVPGVAAPKKAKKKEPEPKKEEE